MLCVLPIAPIIQPALLSDSVMIGKVFLRKLLVITRTQQIYSELEIVDSTSRYHSYTFDVSEKEKFSKPTYRPNIHIPTLTWL